MLEITTIAVGLTAVIVAVLAAFYTRRQVEVAQHAIKQAASIRLFSTFDLANQANLDRPEFLYSIHGLDKSIPKEEAANIAYLSLLMDGFHRFYGERYDWDFTRMTEEFQHTSTFLTRLLQVPENQARWEHVKKLYYGDIDKVFVDAIDELIAFERSK